MTSIAATETGGLSGKRPNWATVRKSRRARMNYWAETVRPNFAGSAEVSVKPVSGEQRGFLPPIHIREVKGTVKSKNLERKALNPAACCIFARVRPTRVCLHKVARFGIEMNQC